MTWIELWMLHQKIIIIISIYFLKSLNHPSFSSNKESKDGRHSKSFDHVKMNDLDDLDTLELRNRRIIKSDHKSDEAED